MAGVAGSGLASAQTVPADESRSLPTFARLGYETITLPGDERLGLVGSTYLVQPLNGLCVGPAVYGGSHC